MLNLHIFQGSLDSSPLWNPPPELPILILVRESLYKPGPVKPELCFSSFSGWINDLKRLSFGSNQKESDSVCSAGEGRCSVHFCLKVARVSKAAKGTAVAPSMIRACPRSSHTELSCRCCACGSRGGGADFGLGTQSRTSPFWGPGGGNGALFSA